MNEQVPGLTSMFSPTDYFVLASFSGQYQSVVHCGPGRRHVSCLTTKSYLFRVKGLFRSSHDTHRGIGSVNIIVYKIPRTLLDSIEWLYLEEFYPLP